MTLVTLAADDMRIISCVGENCDLAAIEDEALDLRWAYYLMEDEWACAECVGRRIEESARDLARL